MPLVDLSTARKSLEAYAPDATRLRGRSGLWLLLVGALGGCRVLASQVAISTVHGCITQNCTSPDGYAYARCLARCRAAYGP
jgi:hypothetical protein